MIKGSCRRFNEGAGDVAPHRNSSPLNGTTNPCRDGAVHTIGLPSMWRNIPATLSHTQHHQLAVHNHCEMVPLSKTLTERKDELAVTGDSVWNMVFSMLLLAKTTTSPSL